MNNFLQKLGISLVGCVLGLVSYFCFWWWGEGKLYENRISPTSSASQGGDRYTAITHSGPAQSAIPSSKFEEISHLGASDPLALLAEISSTKSVSLRKHILLTAGKNFITGVKSAEEFMKLLSESDRNLYGDELLMDVAKRTPSEFLHFIEDLPNKRFLIRSQLAAIESLSIANPADAVNYCVERRLEFGDQLGTAFKNLVARDLAAGLAWIGKCQDKATLETMESVLFANLIVLKRQNQTVTASTLIPNAPIEAQQLLDHFSRLTDVDSLSAAEALPYLYNLENKTILNQLVFDKFTVTDPKTLPNVIDALHKLHEKVISGDHAAFRVYLAARNAFLASPATLLTRNDLTRDLPQDPVRRAFVEGLAFQLTEDAN